MGEVPEARNLMAAEEARLEEVEGHFLVAEEGSHP